VVVPVRDRAEELAGLLAALEPVGSVVVVDDGSADPGKMASVVESAGGRLVRRSTSGGPAAARNEGWPLARTALVAFLDSDAVPRSGWLEGVVAHFADEAVAMVAPRVVSVPGASALARHEVAHSPLDMGSDPAVVRPRSRVSYVPAAALVVRTRALDQLGGFDESLRFGEDVDLVWRATAEEQRVRYEPTAVVEHAPRATWAAWARQRFDYGTSAAVLDDRHPWMAAPAVVSPWSAGVWAMVGAGHPVPAAAVAAGSAVALARKLPDVDRHEAIRLVLEGHLGAGRQLTRAVIRPWWPAFLGAAVVSRRARRVLMVSVAIHLATTPGSPATRAIALADDATYGLGVWIGAVRRRSVRSLLPALPSWP